MTAFLALVQKDLLLFAQDRRALLLNLLAPVLIAAFFGYLFGGSGQAAKPARVPIAVVNLDGDAPLTRQIVAGLQADESLNVLLLDAAAAEAQVREGKLRVAVQFPAGFGVQAQRALFGGGAKPELTLTHDPSQSFALPLVRGLLTQQVMQAVSRQAFAPDGAALADARSQLAQAASMPAVERAELERMFDSIAAVQARSAAASSSASNPASNPLAGGLSTPFETRLVQAAAANGPQGYNGYAHSFAGMGVQFVLMLGVEWGVALLLMRRMDLWKRLRVAPVGRGVLLGSRLASGSLIAFGQFAAILAIGMAVFGVRVLGSWAGLLLLLVSTALLTASFGLMIAALGRTPEATRGLAIVATLLMVMLGGAWVPSFIFPEWLQTVTLFIPTRWAVDGLDAMTWRGLGLDAALPAVGVLLGFALAFALLALWRFRWEE
ncbi:MAG: ABC-2 transporter permease [Burkholderiales bacterium]|nr:ABC-2 transporter permease [Burkholderiales bacterium]